MRATGPVRPRIRGAPVTVRVPGVGGFEQTARRRLKTAAPLARRSAGSPSKARQQAAGRSGSHGGLGPGGTSPRAPGVDGVPARPPVFAPEGTRLIVAAVFVGAALAIAGLLIGGWGLGLVALGALAFGFTLWFFRDPHRTPPLGADLLLLAPADGRVVEIVEEHEPVYLKGPSQRVSISVSPLNVHVNRSPVTGTVELERRVPGGTAAGRPPGAGGRNERSEVGLRHASGVSVLVKQIARRITYDAPRGRRMAAGERYGVLTLGSRLDVAVPPHVELDVAVGQRTVAGETVIGRLPAAASGDGVAAEVGAPFVEVA